MGTVEEFSLEIDEAGNVIANGNMGDTGHVNEGYDENVFHILTTNRHGIMIVDDQFFHATYGEYESFASNYYLGALEKDVMVAPLYSVSDIVDSYPLGGTYAGSAGIWEGDAISIAVSSDLTFTGTATEGNFSGGFDPGLYDSSHGRYAGTLTRQILPPVMMDISAYISPDGSALSVFASESGTVPGELEDFILIGFKK